MCLKKYFLYYCTLPIHYVQLAAKRLVSYWEKRVEIFGPEDAFKPLTLQTDGALVEDSVALGIGLMRLTGAKDDSGRIILFADPSRQDKTKYTTKSMAKAVWYVLHAALEDEDAQKHGIVLVVFPHKAKVTQMDRQLIKLLAGSLKDRIPVRLAGFHICHPPTFFRVIFPIISLVLGPRLRKRIRIHAGSTEKVQEELNAYGLTRNKLPSELEGEIVLDHQAWLEQRRAAGK